MFVYNVTVKIIILITISLNLLRSSWFIVLCHLEYIGANLTSEIVGMKVERTSFCIFFFFFLPRTLYFPRFNPN